MLHLGSHIGPGKAFKKCGIALLAKTDPQFRVLRKKAQGGCQLNGGSALYENAAAMSEYLAGAATVGTNHRQSGGERFHVDQAEWLFPHGRRTKYIGFPE
jgi:hypothetical protein